MDILELAREAGFEQNSLGMTYTSGALPDLLERFYHAAYAAGVAAEKARCAALCSEVAAGRDAEAIEEAILARGEK
jgi:hypothetical protein